MSNVDCRGVARGLCSQCGQCDVYTYVPKSERSTCGYCECPAIFHKPLNTDENKTKVGAETTSQSLASLKSTPSSESSQGTFDSSSSSGLSGSSIQVLAVGATGYHHLSPLQSLPSTSSFNIRNFEGLDHAYEITDVTDNSSLNSSSLDTSLEAANTIELNPDHKVLESILQFSDVVVTKNDIPLPPITSDDLKEALRSGKLERNQRSSICRNAVCHLTNLGLDSNAHLKAAADKIVEEYPPMKRLSDPENNGLYRKLLKCRNRKKRGGSKSAGAKTPKRPCAALSERESQEEMVSQWASGHRSVTIMAPLLTATRELRKKEANKEKALTILVKFPALSIPSLLLEEFAALEEIQVPILTMRQNWQSVLPHLKSYLEESSICSFEGCLSPEHQTTVIMNNLHKVKAWAQQRSVDEKKVRVLQIFPENTPMAEARPKASDPLRLIAIGDVLGNIDFHAVTDSEPIFATKDPIEAFLLLLATYWVFSLKLMAANKQPILFLAASVLGGPLKIRKYVSSYGKFVDLCEKCKMVV